MGLPGSLALLAGGRDIQVCGAKEEPCHLPVRGEEVQTLMEMVLWNVLLGVCTWTCHHLLACAGTGGLFIIFLR